MSKKQVATLDFLFNSEKEARKFYSFAYHNTGPDARVLNPLENGNVNEREVMVVLPGSTLFDINLSKKLVDEAKAMGGILLEKDNPCHNYLIHRARANNN